LTKLTEEGGLSHERHGRAEGQQQEHRRDPLPREEHKREAHGDHGEEVVSLHQLDPLDDEREAEAEDESLHEGPARQPGDHRHGARQAHHEPQHPGEEPGRPDRAGRDRPQGD
jgi:hypothetical protein